MAFRTHKNSFATQLDRILLSIGTPMREVAHRTGLSSRTISSWRLGQTLPHRKSFDRLIVYLESFAAPSLIDAVRESYREARNLPPEHDTSRTVIPREATEQVPAAFRFGVRHGKIDALPDNLETLDRATAEDLYKELIDKLGTLVDRFKLSNSDLQVRGAAERLLESLGSTFGSVRPGVVLSRIRSLEATVKAFDSEEGRSLVFPDAIAALIDVVLTGQDFLATFPVVRRIERERIALGLDSTPLSVEATKTQAATISAVASKSSIVTAEAAQALKENEREIENAQDDGVRSELLADTLLVQRNFLSAALRSIRDFGINTWDVVGDDFKQGAQHAARILPPLAVIGLLTAVAGPVAGIAGLLRGDIFKPVRTAISRVKAEASRQEKRRQRADKRSNGIVRSDGLYIGGVRYDTIAQLSRDYGLSKKEIRKRIDDGDWPGPRIFHNEGHMIEYFDDEWYKELDGLDRKGDDGTLIYR